MPNSKGLFSECWSEHRFVSFDETVIYYRCFLTPQTSRGVIVILHGMGEHGGRYQALAEHLGSLGFDLYVPDLRGFGQSGGKRGCIDQFEDYFRDLDVVARLAKQRVPRMPLFILGHSFGGLIAASWVAFNPDIDARGLILTSPNFGIAIHVPVWRHWLAVVGSCLTPDFTQDNRVDSNFLTHDPTIYNQYKMDRFIHHRISARLYRELIRQLARKNKIASKLSLPALVLQAGDDRVVLKQATLSFFDQLASEDKKLEVFPELYHEILNETNRNDIFEKISSWVIQRL